MDDKWLNIFDVLFDGTKEQINQLSCPECGASLKVNIEKRTRSMEISCVGCHTLIRTDGHEEVPNCLKYFGSKCQTGKKHAA